MSREIRRRDFLASGLVTVGAAIFGPALWRGLSAAAAPAQPGEGPYGPLQEPDQNGLMLPKGFTSRVIAQSTLPVLPSAYVWHIFPDGGATFATDDGGWIYVSNSEVPQIGGVGAIRFTKDGDIADAYPILSRTSTNCAGGPTPWGTWLSCEETATGQVWECDPMGERPGEVRPAMGSFAHEAAAVDPKGKQVYLTEDEGDGRFYRFTPSAYPDLATGTLEAARVTDLKAVLAGGKSEVTWLPIGDPTAAAAPTREQQPGSTPFDGGEGCWYDAGTIYFTTKGDSRVWIYRPQPGTIELLYDADRARDPILTGVDNVFVSPKSGDVFVAEDGGDLDVVILTPNRVAARLLKLTGEAHTGSEITGPAMDPSGERFYFSSQRGRALAAPAGFEIGSGFGITYEITGPFRKARVLGAEAPATSRKPARRDTQPRPQAPSSELPATGTENLAPAGAALLGAAGVVAATVGGASRPKPADAAEVSDPSDRT